MKKRWLIIPVVFFLIVGSILFFPKAYDEGSPVLTLFNTFDGDRDDGNGGGSGSSGSGSQTGNEEGSPAGCVEGIIPYAVKNLRVNEECIEFQNNACSRKRIGCLFDVYNLDHGVNGDFGFNLYVIEKDGSSKNSLDYSYLEAFINARGKEEMGDSFEISGSDAEKSLECVYASQKIPERVCR